MLLILNVHLLQGDKLYNVLCRNANVVEVYEVNSDIPDADLFTTDPGTEIIDSEGRGLLIPGYILNICS